MGTEALRRARTASLSDDVLVAAAQDGDLQAFGLLVERYQAPIYRLAVRMLRSEADAQDVAQEVFVQAWRKIGSFRGDASFSTWLHRIATNRCLNAIAARRPSAPLPEDQVDRAGTDSDLSVEVERRHRFAQLAEVIAQLPTDQRVALVLRDLQGLSYEEIAGVLRVSLSTVKGRIHRARLAVVQRMEELG
jgi:RNA polymerase sigma-70 factor, ECF subfamily